MAVWSVAFLESWKRHESALAHKWGVGLVAADEEVRPEFSGVFKYSVWIGGSEPVTRRKDVLRRMAISPALAIVGLAVTAGVTVGLVLRRADFYAIVLPTDNTPPHPGWLSGGALTLGLAAALAGTAIEPIHAWAALRTVDIENHRTQASVEVESILVYTFDLAGLLAIPASIWRSSTKKLARSVVQVRLVKMISGCMAGEIRCNVRASTLRS
jgi:hypothetical protein